LKALLKRIKRCFSTSHSFWFGEIGEELAQESKLQILHFPKIETAIICKVGYVISPEDMEKLRADIVKQLADGLLILDSRVELVGYTKTIDGVRVEYETAADRMEGKK